jgi:hypothetical protein
MLWFVDPDLKWTYLDPTLARPIPQVCHFRHELEEQLAGEEDEDEPAPGPTQGIRVERDDRRW